MADRRTILILGGLAAGALAVPQVLRHRAALPEAVPIRHLPGFSRIQSGALSAAGAGLVGIEHRARPSDAVIAQIEADPAAHLFDHPTPGNLPVAVFSDVNCPNCRSVSAILMDWLKSGREPIEITWHELPWLGPTSLLGAKAIYAAEAQGGGLAMHDRLTGTQFRPSPQFLAQIATEIGLDPDRLRADLDGPEVARRLERAEALAYVFGIPGTPALVVGRTLVVGALPAPQLRRLVRDAL